MKLRDKTGVYHVRHNGFSRVPNDDQTDFVDFRTGYTDEQKPDENAYLISITDS